MRLPLAFLACAAFANAAGAQTAVQRGEYLVTIAGCGDCHTPGGLLGQPDEKRRFGGSDTGFGDPASGVVVGQNLTPDPTGLGKWSDAQIVAALRTGKTPEGRELSPIMPWPALSHLADDDALAIAAYLKSLPAVKNATPGPFKPGETPTVAYVSTVIPVATYLGLPQPKK